MLTKAGVITKPISHEDIKQIALTRWDDGFNPPLEVPWLSVKWKTFWHTDYFFRLWNRGLRKTRQICREPAHLKSNELAHLLGVFTTVALIATASKQASCAHTDLDSKISEFLRAKPDDSTGKQWSWSIIKVDAMINAAVEQAKKLVEHSQGKYTEGNYDDEAEQIDEALINLVLMTMPEVNIPKVKTSAEVNQGSVNEGEQPKAAQTGRIAPESLTEKLKVILDEESYVCNHLAREIRRRRLRRIGLHAFTDQGLRLLTAPEQKALNPSQGELQAVLLLHQQASENLRGRISDDRLTRTLKGLSKIHARTERS